MINATATATVNLGGDQWQTVPFTASDISAGVVKSVYTTNIAQATITSLLANTQINVQLLGLGIAIGSASANTALVNSLEAVGAPLDQVLNGLTALLGVRLGEADVKVNGVRCKGAALVA